jgi:hypothetical protein
VRGDKTGLWFSNDYVYVIKEDRDLHLEDNIKIESEDQ